MWSIQMALADIILYSTAFLAISMVFVDLSREKQKG